MIGHLSSWLGSLSKVSSLTAVAALMFGNPCQSCREEIQCRTFDVDDWCKRSSDCHFPTEAECDGGCAAAFNFTADDYPQTIWVPLAPILPKLKALPLILVQPWGFPDLPPIEVRLDEQTLSCEPLASNWQRPNRSAGIACPLPDSIPNPVFLRVIAPPTTKAFSVDVSFSEAKCTGVIDVCAV